MAGHSKWAQIKHKKAVTDAKKGTLFSKLVREIMVSVRTGGKSPDTNTRLRTALERARAAGLPKDNIERAITKASGEGEETTLTEFIFEAAAPGGVSVIIEGITDSKNRTTAEIKHILSERGGRLAEPGSLMWNFKKIGTLAVAAADNPGQAPEKLEEAIIESGADDFSFAENEWAVETDFQSREKVRTELERRGVAVREAGHDYKPGSTTALGPDARETLEKLLDELSEHDDVQELYTNLAQ